MNVCIVIAFHPAFKKYALCFESWRQVHLGINIPAH